MLNYYLQQMQRLLRDQKQMLDNIGDLTTFINIARGQIAGEAKCIRAIGTVTAVIGQAPYNYSTITGFGSGIAGALTLDTMQYGVGSGQAWVNPRPWPWYQLYYLNNAVPVNGAPKVWSIYGQGSAPGAIGQGGATTSGGSFYIGPPPDSTYTLYCDCSCYPSPLVLDSDTDVMPYPWTDCVPIFATYLAYLERGDAKAADQYFQMYQMYATRAINMVSPLTNQWQSQKALDPMQIARVGQVPA